jgi:hypothetical protein
MPERAGVLVYDPLNQALLDTPDHLRGFDSNLG